MLAPQNLEDITYLCSDESNVQCVRSLTEGALSACTRERSSCPNLRCVINHNRIVTLRGLVEVMGQRTPKSKDGKMPQNSK